MASGIPVHPWSIVVAPPSTAVTPPSTAVTLPATDARPVSLDKTEFKRLIDLRRKLSLIPTESPSSALVTQRFKALLQSPEATPEAMAELSKAVSAEQQRRTEAAATRKAILGDIQVAVSQFESENREQALEVYEGYLKELQQHDALADAINAEIATTKKRITALKGSKAKRPTHRSKTPKPKTAKGPTP